MSENVGKVNTKRCQNYGQLSETQPCWQATNCFCTKKRRTADNVMLGQELLCHHPINSNPPKWALKLNFMKAFLHLVGSQNNNILEYAKNNRITSSYICSN